LTEISRAAPRRRSDAGRVRLQQRDLDGLLLIADHYAAPYDLLAQSRGPRSAWPGATVIDDAPGVPQTRARPGARILRLPNRWK
jgi:hypothetical protein